MSEHDESSSGIVITRSPERAAVLREHFQSSRPSLDDCLSREWGLIYWRVEACTALEAGPDVIERLLELSRRATGLTGARAVVCLHLADHEEAWAHWLGAIAKEDSELRQELLRMTALDLSKIPPEHGGAVQAALASCLHDASSNVRYWAAVAIRALNEGLDLEPDPSLLTRLDELRADPAGPVSMAATETMVVLTATSEAEEAGASPPLLTAELEGFTRLADALDVVEAHWRDAEDPSEAEPPLQDVVLALAKRQGEIENEALRDRLFDLMTRLWRAVGTYHGQHFAQLLAGSQDVRAVPLLRELHDHPSLYGMPYALLGLVRIQGELARPLIEELLAKGRRSQALEALGHLHAGSESTEAVQELEGIAQADPRDLISSAATALERVGGEEAREAITRLLDQLPDHVWPDARRRATGLTLERFVQRAHELGLTSIESESVHGLEQRELTVLGGISELMLEAGVSVLIEASDYFDQGEYRYDRLLDDLASISDGQFAVDGYRQHQSLSRMDVLEISCGELVMRWTSEAMHVANVLDAVNRLLQFSGAPSRYFPLGDQTCACMSPRAWGELCREFHLDSGWH
ncbi:MAG: hypothetical protein AAF533_11425 [Acidobacteriota bacterium]